MSQRTGEIVESGMRLSTSMQRKPPPPINFPLKRATRIFATRVERLHDALVYSRKYVFQTTNYANQLLGFDGMIQNEATVTCPVRLKQTYSCRFEHPFRIYGKSVDELTNAPSQAQLPLEVSYECICELDQPESQESRVSTALTSV